MFLKSSVAIHKKNAHKSISMVNGFCLRICRSENLKLKTQVIIKKKSFNLNTSEFFSRLPIATFKITNFSCFQCLLFIILSVSVFNIPYTNFFLQIFQVAVAPDVVTSCSPSTPYAEQDRNDSNCRRIIWVNEMEKVPESKS